MVVMYWLYAQLVNSYRIKAGWEPIIPADLMTLFIKGEG